MVAHVIVVSFSAFMIYVAWPGSSLFSWHPTLMTLAFVGAMFEGLLVFNPESSLFLTAARQTKILAHQVLQICAVVLAILGFVVIYVNKEIKDKPHFTSWHGLLGLATIIVISLQSLGGDVVKYAGLRSFLGIKKSLAVLKIYHATSGLVAFTFVTMTLMLALYSNWFTQEVDGVLWYLCVGCVSFMAMVVMNRTVSEYLPRTQGYNPGQSAGPSTKINQTLGRKTRQSNKKKQ